MNYPNGRRTRISSPHTSFNGSKQGFGNRGMSLEEDINTTNTFYLETDRAIIHKKPTPVQIVKVNYPKRSAAVITEAYFKQASTTDYNGVYCGTHIDFEAKETKNKTSFPLANIHDHQIKHMESVISHGGICFLIIRFTAYNETYFLQAEHFFSCRRKRLAGGRKSIPYETVRQEGHLIPLKYQARVDYLAIIDKIYF